MAVDPSFVGPGAPPVEAVPSDPPTPDRASILVVDDRPANLVAMEALLAPLGRRVVMARSGEEALRILLAERFALILLDVQMPGMDGFETARLIRGRLRTRRIPIIFVTAVSTATNHLFDGYAAGAVDYLLKPIDPAILRSKVTLFVELFEANARLQRQAARQGMEESLALAQRAGLSGVWDWHLPSDRVRWSGEYADLVGLPAGGGGGDPRSWLATVDPRDRDRVQAGIDAAISDRGTWEEEFRVVHPARGPRWLNARGRVYRDADDQPERFIGIAMDVTERHRAEEELRFLNATSASLAGALTRADVAAVVERQARALPAIQGARLIGPDGPAAPRDEGSRRLPLLADGTALELRQRGSGPADEPREAGFLTAFAAQCAQALERARLHDAERSARHDSEALQAATESLAAAGDRDAVADAIVREAMRTFGAVAVGVRLLSTDGRSLRTIAGGGFADPLVRPVGRSAPDDDTPTAAALSGGPSFAPSHGDVLRAHPGLGDAPPAWPGLESLVALPLMLDDRPVGVVGLRFEGERSFPASERRTLTAFARLAAMSLVRAGLRETEARGRAHAGLLADVGAVMDLEPGVRGRMERVADLLVPAWADGCRIEAVGSESGAVEVMVAARDDALEAALRTGRSWATYEVPGPGEPLAVAGSDDDPDGPFAALVEAGVLEPAAARRLAGCARGLLVAPVVVHGRSSGVVALAFREPPAEPSDAPPLDEVGRRVGLALENARLYEAQVDVATILQRSLLPTALPVVRDLPMAARYLSATAHTEAGGDWYEAVQLPGDRVVLAVGDVVGRGTVAASVMGQLRSAMRAYALAQLAPRAVLEHLSRFAAGVPGAEVSTAVCAEIDLGLGRLSYACAGHPPPLLMDADGGVTWLDGGRGPALGVTDRGYSEATVPFGVGATILLFTDGLVERRSEPLETGLGRLAEAAFDARGERVEGLTDRVLARLVLDLSGDDVALLAARRQAPPEPLDLRLAAMPGSLAEARAAIRGWLAAAAVPLRDADDILLASGEALSNAVEHAYPAGREGELELSLRLTPEGAVEVVVRDEGEWRPPPADPGLRGQGLRIMRAVMDDVRLDAGLDGSVVRMTRGPRQGASARPAPSPPAEPGPPQGVEVGPDGEGGIVAVVSGDVDAVSVRALGEAVAAASAPGDPLTLDMCAVAYVDSSGARLVAELAERQRVGGGRLVLVAPTDGAIRRVMRLAGLDLLGSVELQGPD